MSYETEAVRREILGKLETITTRFDQLELNLLAELRRERDARANLRVELDRVLAERNQARAELVKAMQTIEAAAAAEAGSGCVRDDSTECDCPRCGAAEDSFWREQGEQPGEVTDEEALRERMEAGHG